VDILLIGLFSQLIKRHHKVVEEKLILVSCAAVLEDNSVAWNFFVSFVESIKGQQVKVDHTFVLIIRG